MRALALDPVLEDHVGADDVKMTNDPKLEVKMKVPETVGPYRIEGILGRGGMGEVFRGVHLRLRRTVALKRIHPEKADNPKARARFLREARITARLQSSFLVSVHDVLESPDALWLVMELVEGQSLDRWLETGPPDVGLGLRLAADITAGLTVIHEAGILHRDLASKNVMVTTPRPERDEPIPRARLLDFGLAKDQDETGAPLTSTGNLIGTPRAMSPEQANGKAMDVRSDLFSLGALFYELFVGVSPFAAQTALETLGRICHHEPDPMRRHRPELPETLDRWVGRLLAKDPTERPRSAREVSAALDSLLYLEAASGLESDSGSFPASTPQGRRPRLSHVGSWNEGRSERRQLTVVCGELVGTEREGGDASGSLEPEALLQVLGPFHGWLRRVLEQYGGYLGELRDHRVELYFGWPQAQEHDIQKAVAAALELADSGGRLQDPRPEKPGLAVRVGVHLGPVMRVATADERERLVLGEIAERAAALRDAAGPGEVWGSATVSRQVAGQYRIERQAPVSAPGASGLDHRGWPEGEGTARIQRLPGEESPGEPSLPEPSVTVQAKTPMVGRQWELDLLRGRLRQAAEGVGQAVSIIGDPGIGKTRLLEAFREQPGGPASFQVCRGSAFRECDTLAPLADLVRRLLGVDELRDLGRQRQDREGQDEAWAMQLSQALESYDLPTEDLMPTLGLWLGLEKNDTGIGFGSPRGDREAAQVGPELVLELVEQRFETDGPTVLIFEDLQWVGPVALQVLEALIERVAASPLLLLMSARTEFQPPWGLHRRINDLRLRPLDGAESSELLANLGGEASGSGRDLDDEQRSRLIERSRGYPRVLEELARTLWDPSLRFPGSEVPIALFDGLMARLDRLGTARELARVAALTSGIWTERELRQWRLWDPIRLDHEIGRLLDAGVWVRAEDDPEDRSFAFADPLLCEVALASLTEQDKAQLERQIPGREAD